MAKIRVYELAKELGVESKTVMAKLQELGEFVRSASSTIEAPTVRKLDGAFRATSLPPQRSAIPEGVPNKPSRSGSRSSRSRSRPRRGRDSRATPPETTPHQLPATAGLPVTSSSKRDTAKQPQIQILKTRQEILETWEQIKKCVPESQRNKAMWLVGASGISRARVFFAESVRNWIAHPDGGHEPQLDTLKDALQVMEEIKSKLSS